MDKLAEMPWRRLKELTELKGTSGNESQIRNYMAKEMEGKVEKIEISGLGNIFGLRPSQDRLAPRVMIASHMDEVGFMVERIEANGTFSVVPIGGWNVYAVPAQRFILQSRQGDIPVISSAVSPHLLKKGGKQQNIRVNQIRFDGGFVSKEEAEDFGIRPGDPIVPDTETVLTANGKGLFAKAIDNRYGCALVLDALDALENTPLPYNLIAGATVQEEVGLRGVKGAVHKYKPDLFIAVDASPAGDGEGDPQAQGKLGEGFLLRVYDPGHISHRGLWHFIEDLAKEKDIPFQYYLAKGGTDAGAAHVMNDGVPSAVIGLPARYIHGHQSLMRLSDYEAASQMLVTLLKTLTPEIIEKIKG